MLGKWISSLGGIGQFCFLAYRRNPRQVCQLKGRLSRGQLRRLVEILSRWWWTRLGTSPPSSCGWVRRERGFPKLRQIVVGTDEGVERWTYPQKIGTRHISVLSSSCWFRISFLLLYYTFIDFSKLLISSFFGSFVGDLGWTVHLGTIGLNKISCGRWELFFSTNREQRFSHTGECNKNVNCNFFGQSEQWDHSASQLELLMTSSTVLKFATLVLSWWCNISRCPCAFYTKFSAFLSFLFL